MAKRSGRRQGAAGAATNDTADASITGDPDGSIADAPLNASGDAYVPPPANDRCADATVIDFSTMHTDVHATTAGATAELEPGELAIAGWGVGSRSGVESGEDVEVGWRKLSADGAHDVRPDGVAAVGDDRHHGRQLQR